MSRLRANKITNQAADGAPTVQHGLIVSGVTTVTGSINNLNLTGITTVTTLDLNGDIDVDGHTNLDNVSVAGVTTFTGKVNIGDNQMSSNLLNIEDGTAAAIDIASHGTGGDTAYIGVKKSSGGGLTFGISNRDIIFKTGASYSSGTTFDSGTERLRITSNGKVGIGSDDPQENLDIRGAGASVIRLSTNNTLSYTNLRQNQTGKYFEISPSSTSNQSFIVNKPNGDEALRIDNNGKVLIGSTTHNSTLASGVGSQLQIEGTTYATSGISMINNQASTDPAFLTFGKSRAGSNGGTTVVQSGDRLGGIRFAGADGTDLHCYGAEINCFVDGTPGSNDMPGRIVFNTTPDGAASPTTHEILYGSTKEIRNSGYYVAQSAGSGGSATPSFGATQSGMSASSYNYILSGSNDGGNKCVLFVNGSTRGSDGGNNGLTFRNDGGPLTLGHNSQRTTLRGDFVVYPERPVFHVTNFTWTNSTKFAHGGTATYNRGDDWNVSTGTFTAPVGGDYVMFCSVQVHAPNEITGRHADYSNLYAQKNGSNIGGEIVGTTQTGGYGFHNTITHSLVVYLAANDTFRWSSNYGFRYGQNTLYGYLLG